MMSQQNINVEPCSPQIGIAEPSYPTTFEQSDDKQPSLLLSPTNQRSAHPTLLQQHKKYSTSSFNTSVDTDDELQNSNEFEYSNASLSDSQTHRHFHERLHMLSPNRFKKLKKKNRLTQIISGANYKSKSELFQKLFKNLNPDEQLIIDYSCAFHRDILVHGRLYLSQNWLCFYANIFGWETLITIQWVDITAITKEKTAKVIPNAIQVLTDNEKFFFTTFVTRENAYTALFRIWQNALLGQPMQPAELKSLCKKYRQKKLTEAVDGDPVHDFLDETGDEVAEDELTSTNGSNDHLNKTDDICGTTSENIESNDKRSVADIPTEGNAVVENENIGESVSGVQEQSSTNGEKNETEESIPRKPTSSFLNGSLGQEETKERIKHAFKHSIPNMTTRSFSKASDLFRKKKKAKARHHHSIHLTVPDDDAGETTTDFEDGDSDVSTDNRLDEDVLCPCYHSHTGTEYINEEFDLDVDALYAHMFSQESDLMKRVFEERKHENWRYTPLVKDDEGNGTQTLTYTLNLNYSIGPKTSETISQQKILKDSTPGSFYIITTENRSIGVPYSDSFHASVRYCLTKASGNRSRLKVFGEIVYTKRVFGLVKNMISRNGDEAMKDYYIYLIDILRSESDTIPVQNNVLKRKPKKKPSKKLGKEPSKTLDTSQRNISHDTVKPLISPKQQDAAMIQPVSTSALIAICAVIFLLLGMNVYLLRRLGTLESAVFIAKRGWLPKEMPKSKEEWKNLLEYQKNLHELELMKLKEVIGNTALLVRQVEESISSLHSELNKYDGNSNHLSDDKLKESKSAEENNAVEL